jgi:hypothetical protein
MIGHTFPKGFIRRLKLFTALNQTIMSCFIEIEKDYINFDQLNKNQMRKISIQYNI